MELVGEVLRHLSEHIFELVQNSITAGAKHISVKVEENPEANHFRLVVVDDGYGIKPTLLAHIQDTFFSTRPQGQRHIGLGLSMMATTCQQTGGELKVDSKYRHGTTITAIMEYYHIDRPPLGDLADLYASLMVSSHENGIMWQLEHHRDDKAYRLKNRQALDELNLLSFGERGVKRLLQDLFAAKEAQLPVQ